MLKLSKLLTEKEYNKIGIADKNFADVTVKELFKMQKTLIATRIKNKQPIPDAQYGVTALHILCERATKKGLLIC